MLVGAAIFLAGCAAIIMVRVFLGPTVGDRLVSFDSLSNLIIMSMVLLGAAFKEVIYIDVAIVYGLLSFVGTLFVAKFVEKGKF
jgi:multicomponent Na+:H+ antiporter subunit F